MDTGSWIRRILGSRIQYNYICSCAVSSAEYRTVIIYPQVCAPVEQVGQTYATDIMVIVLRLIPGGLFALCSPVQLRAVHRLLQHKRARVVRR